MEMPLLRRHLQEAIKRGNKQVSGLADCYFAWEGWKPAAVLSHSVGASAMRVAFPLFPRALQCPQV
jgi:hypothetical protein